MGLYQYGVGGNEVKVDANESIAEFATFGGPVGLTVGLVYWGLDLLGVFDEGTIMPKSTNRPDIYIAPIDNLRVVSPRYSILNQLNTP